MEITTATAGVVGKSGKIDCKLLSSNLQEAKGTYEILKNTVYSSVVATLSAKNSTASFTAGDM